MKLDTRRGKHYLSVLAATKSSALCQVAALASEIKSSIGGNKLIYKLKKCVCEQKQRKNKDVRSITEANLSIKCLNTQLSWEKAHHNLSIRRVKRIPSNASLVELQNHASLVKQEHGER